MSLTAIKPWFQKRLSKLEFKEHPDGFNVGNIDELNFDRAWHFRLTNVNGKPISMTDQSTDSDCEIQVYLSGDRDSASAIDSAIYEVEQIVKECCNIKNRTSDGLLNVVFKRAEIAPRGSTNDISVLVTLDFSVTVLIGIEE